MTHPDSSSLPAAGVIRHAFAPGPGFLEACAQALLASARPWLPDLSSLVVVLPNQHIAPALRRTLARVAARPLWLPQLLTLTGLMREPLSGIAKDSDAARVLRLHQVLSRHSLFADQGRWALAHELAQVFDELCERAAPLPQTEDELEGALARGYGVAPNLALSFEAQFVHTLWQADCAGAPSLAAALQQAMRDYAAAHPPGVPLFFIGDGLLSPKEQCFIDALAERAEVHLFVPDREADATDALLASLNAAWPKAATDVPIATRAARLREQHPACSLADRVQFLRASSLENEAAAVAHRVRERLLGGAQSIALIAADRVASRRARAALLDLGIEVSDETGWLLSTTRAAALIDAVLEMVASRAYHRALLDLVKAPFVCADWPPEQRAQAVWGLEQRIARHNFISGLPSLARLVAREGEGGGVPSLVARVQAAFASLSQPPAGVADWIARLLEALDQLGARQALDEDAAGQEVLALLATRAQELAGQGARLPFQEWREWLDHQLERAMFRDESVTSPVVMTHLAAARLRRFDCAVVVGADRAHLAAPGSAAIFAHQAVRRELGLSTRSEDRARLREDLALLIAHCDEVLFTRQAMQGDEVNLPSPELEVLSLLHRAAGGGSLEIAPHVSPLFGDDGGLMPQTVPAPRPGPARVPDRLSASGYGALVACPYRYFARHVLGLGESEEVTEALEKSDYGERVHAILHAFHSAHGVLEDYPVAQLEAALCNLAREHFAQAVEHDFLEHAWLTRWLKRVSEYVRWACERERQGWRWAAGEQPATRTLALEDGATLTLQGRIDRIDHGPQGAALLDYKTQTVAALKDKMKDADLDVQLPFYSLLHSGRVGEAAYVALDDERIDTLAAADLAQAAERHFVRIRATFSALREGAALPAHGTEEICARCEMHGVCRKAYHT